jgi:hypothetical protein
MDAAMILILGVRMPDWAVIYTRLKAHIKTLGICVAEQPMELTTTGVFDGLSIITNSHYDSETRCYNIAHSLGHIVQWSLDFPRFEALYHDLHAAKEGKATASQALVDALKRFRAYEEEASQYAAWLLEGVGGAEAIPAFTRFARADIEAIVAFHRDGVAPAWDDFFRNWNSAVEQGRVTLRPFEPKALPPFTPVAIALQEVIRETPCPQ